MIKLFIVISLGVETSFLAWLMARLTKRWFPACSDREIIAVVTFCMLYAVCMAIIVMRQI